MKDDDKPKRRHLNRAEKRSLLAATVGLFMKRCGRTARRGGLDPNDRSFDRDTLRHIEKMTPDRLDLLMRDDEE